MPDRPGFRRRLLGRLGAALAAALALVGAAVWGGVAVWSTHEARAALRAEARDVAHAVVRADGALAPDAYTWDEPHHRFASPRLDPYFLQVFDARGRLVRASANVRGGPLPAAPLARTDGDGPADPLARLADRRFYRITEGLRAPDGREVGVVQITRYVPAVPAGLGRLAAALALGLAALLGALLAIFWVVGGRVVRPLASITASRLSSGARAIRAH